MGNAIAEPVINKHKLSIRPIRSSDTNLEAEFIENLSDESRYYRFLGAINKLTPDMLKRMCDVDGKQSMAFVATITEDSKERIIGVSRFAPNSKEDTREMAISVADEWQNHGVGTMLAEKLIEFARSHGIKTLYSVDLAHNEHMHQLAGSLGMTSQIDPEDSHNLIYTLAL